MVGLPFFRNRFHQELKLAFILWCLAHLSKTRLRLSSISLRWLKSILYRKWKGCKVLIRST